MQTILVATDYSAAATNAAEYAARLAKEFNYELCLFHSFHVPFMESEVYLEGYTPSELQLEHEEKLRRRAGEMSSKYGIKIRFTARMGFAVDTIIEEEKKSGFIVMGMKAHTETDRIFGSIATSILKRIKKPLLIIPENASYRDPGTVVLACDESVASNDHPINLLQNFLNPFRSDIHVLNIRPEGETVDKQKIKANLERKLQNSHLYYHFFENKNLVDTINDFIEEQHADMMAIIPHHYHIIDRLFHKSISREIAFTTKIPLLALPETQSESHVYFF